MNFFSDMQILGYVVGIFAYILLPAYELPPFVYEIHFYHKPDLWIN